MEEFDPKRSRRIAVEEAFIIPEIASLDGTRAPGRSETSKRRETRSGRSAIGRSPIASSKSSTA